MDPERGEFLAQDPYAGDDEGPISLHRYLYARVDPVNYTDPSGDISLIPLLLGNAVHKAIAIDYIAYDPLVRRYNLSINTLRRFWGNGPAPLIGRFRPDLIDAIGRSFFEIKPDNAVQIAQGYGQIALYWFGLNINSNVPWRVGQATDYIPPPLITGLPLGFSAIVLPPVNGLITYQLVNPQAAGAAVFVALFVSTIQQIYALTAAGDAAGAPGVLSGLEVTAAQQAVTVGADVGAEITIGTVGSSVNLTTDFATAGLTAAFGM